MAIMTRPPGRTQTDVTILGYGAMELRGLPRGPEIADEDAGRLLNAVLDGGINLIDTSPDYGRSEELIGRYVANRRDEFFLASKCGCLMELPTDVPPPYPHDYSPGNVRAVVERSLRRLRTDHLDSVQVHMSPSRATLEENHTVQTLQELRDENWETSGIEDLLADAGMPTMEFVLASPSATRACRPPSSAPRTRRTWPPTSRQPRRGPCLPTSTNRRRSASRSNKPTGADPSGTSRSEACWRASAQAAAVGQTGHPSMPSAVGCPTLCRPRRRSPSSTAARAGQELPALAAYPSTACRA